MGNYDNEQELYNSICEASGCFAKATDRIKVRAGTQKIISLQLCSDCVSKFEETSQA
jgi:hypothetical protein